MRKKLQGILERKLDELLKARWPEVRKLDPRREAFNGVFGYCLGRHEQETYFLTVIPHDARDSFRLNVAWGPRDSYPHHPFRDLGASIETYLHSPSAELQLAQLARDRVPYEWFLDPDQEASEQARELITARLSRGEAVSPDEWLKTLQRKPCSVEQATERINKMVFEIAEALENFLRPLIQNRRLQA